jgi:hypothetical protein
VADLRCRRVQLNQRREHVFASLWSGKGTPHTRCISKASWRAASMSRWLSLQRQLSFFRAFPYRTAAPTPNTTSPQTTKTLIPVFSTRVYKMSLGEFLPLLTPTSPTATTAPMQELTNQTPKRPRMRETNKALHACRLPRCICRREQMC